MTRQHWLLLITATLIVVQVVALVVRVLTHSFFAHELEAWRITGCLAVAVAIAVFVIVPYFWERYEGDR